VLIRTKNSNRVLYRLISAGLQEMADTRGN